MTRVPLEQARVANGGRISLSGGESLTFYDDRGPNWYLVRFDIPQCLFKQITVTVDFAFSDRGTSSFYVNHWGGGDVLTVQRDGAVIRGLAIDAVLEALPGDRWRIAWTYDLHHPTLLLGTRRATGHHHGEGLEQITLYNVDVVSSTDTVDSSERLVLVDVGSRGGLPPEWGAFSSSLEVVMFEPEEAEAKLLRHRSPSHMIVIEKALSDHTMRRPFYVTKLAGCSSLREPKTEFLKAFSVAPCFDVRAIEDVECVRYDELVKNGVVPAPDIIKIDVQGTEFEVLRGFGELLYNCGGIELECHTYEIYKGQRLLHEIVELLSSYGLYLRKLSPQFAFDDLWVEFNAFFTPRASTRLPARRARAVRTVESVWSLRSYPNGAQLASYARDG